MLRALSSLGLAVLLLAQLHAQAVTGSPSFASTQVMSPTVVATWYAQRQADGSNRLELVILWRGSPAWWKQPGGVIGRSRDGETPTEARIEYGRVRLRVRFDSEKRRVSINGDEVTLDGDNVLYVDQVDSPGGPNVVRALRIDSRMPGSAGQIGSMLGHTPQVLAYLQCDARTGNPTLDAELASMCVTNLGRR